MGRPPAPRMRTALPTDRTAQPSILKKGQRLLLKGQRRPLKGQRQLPSGSLPLARRAEFIPSLTRAELITVYLFTSPRIYGSTRVVLHRSYLYFSLYPLIRLLCHPPVSPAAPRGRPLRSSASFVALFGGCSVFVRCLFGVCSVFGCSVAVRPRPRDAETLRGVRERNPPRGERCTAAKGPRSPEGVFPHPHPTRGRLRARGPRGCHSVFIMGCAVCRRGEGSSQPCSRGWAAPGGLRASIHPIQPPLRPQQPWSIP